MSAGSFISIYHTAQTQPETPTAEASDQPSLWKNKLFKHSEVRNGSLICTFCVFSQLDILCNEEILGKDHTLKFVVVTRWRFKVSPASKR